MVRNIYTWLFGGRGRDAVRAPLPPLPDVLVPHEKAIAATVLPIVGGEVLDVPPPQPTGSQLGGLPWWPRGLPYPRAVDGRPLFLLAQIDFADMPELLQFPRQGLLQIFIGQSDHYGANLEDPTKPSGFACIHHVDTTLPMDSDLLLPSVGENGHLPLYNPLEARALVWRPNRMTVDPSDYRFERLLPGIAGDENLLEAYSGWVSGDAAVPAIRLGGYPTFTQEDPRSWRNGAGIGDVSLLTVDTTDGIMWGDSGAAQFLMHEVDLMRRDFSRVAYNWDCC
jgi:uncharacterized protein YwqG